MQYNLHCSCHSKKFASNLARVTGRNVKICVWSAFNRIGGFVFTLCFKHSWVNLLLMYRFFLTHQLRFKTWNFPARNPPKNSPNLSVSHFSIEPSPRGRALTWVWYQFYTLVGCNFLYWSHFDTCYLHLIISNNNFKYFHYPEDDNPSIFNIPITGRAPCPIPTHHWFECKDD